MKAPTTCPSTGGKHSWSFVKNVTVGSMTVTSRGTTGRFTLKGLYRCACGLKKHGRYDPNGSDLRGMVEDGIRVVGATTGSAR